MAAGGALDSLAGMEIRTYGLIFAACVASGCNSDDREQWEFSTTGTTDVDPTIVPVFTTEEPVDTTETPEPPPAMSCRWAINCATSCAVMISPDDVEGEWQHCFDECLAHLNYVEWLLLFDLLECVVPLCSASPECTSDDGLCNACYVAALGAIEPNLPMGCEGQALACD